jgi:hypothetical protein
MSLKRVHPEVKKFFKKRAQKLGKISTPKKRDAVRKNLEYGRKKRLDDLNKKQNSTKK